MKKYITIAAVLSLLVLFGCSSGDDSNDSADAEEFPEYEVHFVDMSVPANIQEQSDNGDMAATWAVTVIELFESVTSFGDDDPIEGTASYIADSSMSFNNSIYTMNYTIDGVTITHWQEKDADYMMAEVTLNGTQESTGIVFDNWIQSEMMCLYGEYEGYWKAYMTNTDNETVDVEWSQETTDKIYLTYMVDDGYGLISFAGYGYYLISAGRMSFHMTIPDGTKYDMLVESDGTGEYQHYASDDSLIDDGTW